MKNSNKRLLVLLQSGIALLVLLSVSACNQKQPSYMTLQSKPSGANLRYMQLLDPTPAQIATGESALHKFKAANKQDRNELAGDLLIAKILIDRPQKEILEVMGPGEFSTDPNLIVYDITYKEKLCQLMILISLGKVSDVYIETI